MTSPQELKATLSHGLLSFPLTDFGAERRFAPKTYATVNRLIDEFFLPCVALRNQGEGYAVSLVKAGATLVGHGAGPVRPPLSDLKPAEVDALGKLISKLGPQ